MTYKFNPLKLYKAAFITIGCRANQADTSRMIAALPSNMEAVSQSSSEVDIFFVNTCTVTSQADADGRNAVRRAKKTHPDSRIVVTGCSVNVDPEPWKSMPEVDDVMNITDRDDIASFLFGPGEGTEYSVDPSTLGVGGKTPLDGHKSRPFLKIQDGCTRGCSFCIVPTARGTERSRKLGEILGDIKSLSEAGYKEIVLTGVHLGRWGWDYEIDFNDLLKGLERIDENVRIRFSSIEPMDLTPELVKNILTHPKVCPHLHIPLQSGDDEILRRMARGHRREHFAELLQSAVTACPDVTIGTDLMTGFPGESESAFENSFSFVDSLPLSYLHVFRYSPRSGTPAAKMKGQIKNSIVKERMLKLKALDNRKRLVWKRKFHQAVRPCLIEIPESDDTVLNAIADNYIRLTLENFTDRQYVGHIIPLKIDTNNVLEGTELPIGHSL